MTPPPGPATEIRERGAVANLGGQLRRVRLDAQLSAREVARQLDVSPSFISQIETGKSQPSVATLYALAQLFAISIDELFEAEHVDPDRDGPPAEPSTPVHDPSGVPPGQRDVGPASRTGSTEAADVDPEALTASRRSGVSVVRSDARATLRLQSGVLWQRLAATSEQGIAFMEVVYPVGSASTSDATMLRHEGYEYHYVRSGTLEVIVNFDTHVLRTGDSMGFDSSLPHLLRNPGEVDAHCIVTTHRCGPAQSE
jgi:DNA-binding XRE family transcriptional regulator